MDYRQRMDLKQQARPRRTVRPEDSFALRAEKRAEDERMTKRAPVKKKKILRSVFIWAFEIVLVIMLAYVAVYFFGQTRTNVGQSMDTTLSGGDIVLINTLAYQMSDPERDEIISFKPGGNNSSRSMIRRVIGLPGETIQIVDGMIQINGKTYLEKKSFPVITNPGIASEPVSLGSGQFFVLGDNRNNSEDSRYADVGIVTKDMIEGRAWYVLNPKERRGRIKE